MRMACEEGSSLVCVCDSVCVFGGFTGGQNVRFRGVKDHISAAATTSVHGVSEVCVYMCVCVHVCVC